MARSREELVEALREEAPRRTLGRDVTSLLTEAADLLDSLEEREEWQVLGRKFGFTLSPVLADRTAVESAASYVLKEGLGRLQSRTVIETPWTDVEEGTDGV